MSIQQIVSSETAVGVRAILTGQAQTGARIAVQIWSAATGETLADISSDIPTSLVSGSGIFRLLMTRFHLGLYNAETLAVFDVLHAAKAASTARASRPNRETPPSQLNASTGLISRVSGLCSISKLSSLGRDIRIDVSDDGTVAIVGPLQTRGELAVIDMDRLSCTTYLLDDAFAEGDPARSPRAARHGRGAASAAHSTQARGGLAPGATGDERGIWIMCDRGMSVDSGHGRRHSISGSHGDGYGPKPPLIVAWQRISL